MWEALLPSLISAGANIFGGMQSAQGASQNNAMQMQMAQQNMQLQRETNAQQLAMFHENQDWQTNMSNTAYQRQMSDMRAAGLNPILAYQKGGGASQPSAPPPQLTAPSMKADLVNDKAELGRAMGNAASSAVDAYKNTQAAELAKQQASTSETQAKLNDVNTKKSAAEERLAVTNERVSNEEVNNRFIQGKILEADHNTAKAVARIKEREAEDAEKWGAAPGIVGQTGASIERFGRRIIENIR